MQKAILPDRIEILFPHARKRARTMCSTLLRGPLFIPVGEIVFPSRPQITGPFRPFRPIGVLSNAKIYGPIGRDTLSVRRGRMRGVLSEDEGGSGAETPACLKVVVGSLPCFLSAASILHQLLEGWSGPSGRESTYTYITANVVRVVL